MSKQSSVEFLFEKLWDTPKDKFEWHTILQQAKAMHMREIVDSYVYGAAYQIDIKNGLSPIFYYKEKFEK